MNTRRLRIGTAAALVVLLVVAINVVVGALTDDPRATVFAPGNCSCTVLDRADDGSLRLLETGGEAITVVR